MRIQRKLNFKRHQTTSRRAGNLHTQNVAAILLIVFALTCVLAESNHAQYGVIARRPSVQSGARQHQVASQSNLPLTFVPNAGQADSQVRFSAQGGGATFYFTPTEAVFSLMTNSRSGVALRLSFVGAHSQTVLAGAKPRSGKVNYLIGRNPDKWRTGLPTYEEIVYQNLWPGIDLRFRGENGELKYEFHLAPGADPRKIQLTYKGTEQLSLGSNGELQIHTAFGVLRDSKPISYQEVAGKRVPIQSHYSLTGTQYGITVGDYDPTRSLVIDPSLSYSTFLGGNQMDSGFDIAVDGSGSAYITGETAASNFPTTVGVFDETFNGATTVGRGDVFVTKLNPSGTDVEYSTYLGGSGNDRGHAIAVDAGGNAYVTGSTSSTDFPTTAGAFDTTDNAGIDAFFTKLDSSGSALVYSSYLGGSLTGVLGGGAADVGNGIVVDTGGNVYVTGGTDSRDFPTTPGAFDTSYTNGAGSHVFVTKVNSSGSALIYSTYLGGGTGESAAGIAVDDTGHAFVTGTTHSVSFPTTTGAYDTTPFVGTDEVFVTKLNPEGTALIYSTFIGGGASDLGTGIAIDAAGNAYVTGWGNSTNYPTTPGAFDVGPPGVGGEAFITKLNPAGSALVFSTYLGGSGSENCFAIAVDSTGNAFVTGVTGSVDFPTTPGAIDRTFNSNEAFLTKLNATGSNVAYSTYLATGSQGRAVATDSFSSVYVTGNTTSAAFPVTADAFQPTIGGGLGGDGFVLKLSNKVPSAENDSVSTDEDVDVTIHILTNDLDADGDLLVVTQVSQGANGSVVLNPDNTVRYSPEPNFNGTDSFDYVIVDTWGDTDTATVNVTINSVNDAPVASDVTALTAEDQSVAINLTASDIDSAQLTFTVVNAPANGALGPISGTTISYSPNANFNGSDSFSFKANDGLADSNVATVLITATPVNDAPIASSDAYSTMANTSLDVTTPGVLTNDIDIDGDVLTAELTTTVSHGTLTLNNNGSFTYTPSVNFSGLDSFSYRVFDGTMHSNVVSVEITVINNELIVFSSTRDGNAEIYSMGIDGSAQTRVTNHPATDLFPTWSPDKSRIAFISDRDGSFEIFVMNADGSAPLRLTTGVLAEGAFDWSPDGTKIVFTSRSDGDPEIYLIDLDGTGLTRLTKNRAVDMTPSWSPDGSKIVFSSDRKRSFEIYVMNANGTGVSQLTKNSSSDIGPDWSLSGAQIVFTSDRDGNREIYSMNIDGSLVTRLTNNIAVDEEPAWSSVGLKILFTSQRDGNAEIYSMNIDGSGQTRLTTNVTPDVSPR